MKGMTQYRVTIPTPSDEGGKTEWRRVGTAFENPDKNGRGHSITIKLSSLPEDGEDLVLFVDKKPAAKAEGEGAQKGEPTL